VVLRRVLLRLLALCLSLLLTFAILEAGFRVFDIRGPEPRKETWKKTLLPQSQRIPGLVVQFRPHSRFKIIYASNPDGYFDSDNSVSYRINNYGFRGPDISMHKPEGTRRVLLLGDSFVMGDGVKEEDTLSSQLERELRKDIPRVEVLNFGVSGWNTRSEIVYLGTMGLKFKPDLVIVVYILNDAVFSTGPPPDLKVEYQRTLGNDLLRRSRAANYFYTRLERYLFSRKYVRALLESPRQHEKAWDKSFEILENGKQITHAAGAEYMVCLFPFLYQLNDRYPLKPLHTLVRNHCSTASIPFLDLLDAFRGMNHARLWVHPTDQHPNAQADRIAAQALAEFIRAHRLLK
jgi:lysophospholipase L1-like esterase